MKVWAVCNKTCMFDSEEKAKNFIKKIEDAIDGQCNLFCSEVELDIFNVGLEFEEAITK